MRLTVAQLNPVVGDVVGNTARVIEAIEHARATGASMLVTSEMSLLGYPPRDLLFRGGVVEACERAVDQIAEVAGDVTVIVGHPRCDRVRGRLRNSASVCREGRVIAVHDKRLLPGYDVFDEDRYFEPGDRSTVFDVEGRRVGLLICEDLWQAGDTSTARRYAVDPVSEITGSCDLLLSIHATHFLPGKWSRHLEQLREAACESGLPIVAVHQVGANDDLIYDGRSVAVDDKGAVVAVLPGWKAAIETIEVLSAEDLTGPVRIPVVEPMAEIFHSLSLGIGDYSRKAGVSEFVLGLSGGIDSSVVACLAVAAVGADKVVGVLMPSRYSSVGSREDAAQLADNLGLTTSPVVSIEGLHQAIEQALEQPLGDTLSGVTDENVQARIRGLLLMAFANARESLLLSTGNKSELAMGYCTMYGDMCGALAPIGDIFKTAVYDLARWINTNHLGCGFTRPPIPMPSITKPPSAELRPNQTDQDTLPPYDELDAILERVIDREVSIAQIVEETGVEALFIEKILRTVDRSQYKRDQAALILKVAPRTFGRGRIMPLVMKAALGGRVTQRDRSIRRPGN